MKASMLLSKIREDLKDYPIDYLKNKATDSRYKDSITKRLAKYNSSVYDEIYSTDIVDDFEIKDAVIDNITSDISFYLEKHGGDDEENRLFTTDISLYLSLIAKKPLHPFTENKKDDVYHFNGDYYCKNRVKYINDENSLCRYCICKNVGFRDMF